MNPKEFSNYADALLLFMKESLRNAGADTGADFNDLALSLFALQFQSVPLYQRFCAARGAVPEKVKHWEQIPALSTVAFKEWDVSSLAPGERPREFHSSGTSAQTPSRHFHNADSLAIYEASLLPWFQRHLLPNWKKEIPGQRLGRKREPAFLILTPSPADAVNSSLVHMFETVRREFGTADSAWLGHAQSGEWLIDVDRCVQALHHAASEGEPVVLLGTAFSFVHLLDHLTLADFRFKLPEGSRVLETGGYKGRSRSVGKTELHALMMHHLGIPATEIVCEYGMSELSSQAYDSIAGAVVSDAVPARRFHLPPWARARIISPETGREVEQGESGLIQIFDLANVRSLAAIQTEDLGVRHNAGFELIGRAEQSEPRGCSRMTT